MSLLDTTIISCPYCGESIELVIDTSVTEQEYIEDCEVCCRPISLFVQTDEEGIANVIPSHENEA